MSQPTQDSTATAPDTIIMTLQKGGMIFCTLLPTPQAALPSSFVAALPSSHRGYRSLRRHVRQLFGQLDGRRRHLPGDAARLM